MKKIVLVALMALCGVSFGFGKSVLYDKKVESYSECFNNCVQYMADDDASTAEKKCEINCKNKEVK